MPTRARGLAIARAAAIGLGAPAAPAMAGAAVTYSLPNPWTAPVVPPEEGTTVVGGGPTDSAPRSTDRTARLQAAGATGAAGALFPFGASLGYVMAGDTGRGVAVGLGQVGADAVVGLVGYQFAAEAIRNQPPGGVDMALFYVLAYAVVPVVLTNVVYSAVAAWDVFHLPVWDPPAGPVTP
ncbi:MAG: hypothetical protein ACK46X_09400 [Candidatus Sericytochromatia bacterium]